MLTPTRRTAILADPGTPAAYFVFTEGILSRIQGGVTEVIAELPMIQEIAHGIGDGRLEGKPLEVALQARGPWVVVSERFGVNAALVNTASGVVRPFTREDYHADVSSYSLALVERDGRTLLIAQTLWNRLDIFDAETGEQLTEREVSMQATGNLDARGSREYVKVNYLDYFHSQLVVSPDTRHFLSNGWVWSPVDIVRAMSVEGFLAGYELSGAFVSVPGGGYNWDRPATFLDNDTFVLALDNNTELIDEEDLADYTYRQLAFFSVADLAGAVAENRGLRPRRLVACDVFRTNSSDEVKGELHVDRESGCLVALTESDGAYVVTLDGEVVEHFPTCSRGTVPAHGDMGSSPTSEGGWSYSAEHRTFYRWAGRVEEQPLAAGRSLLGS